MIKEWHIRILCGFIGWPGPYA